LAAGFTKGLFRRRAIGGSAASKGEFIMTAFGGAVKRNWTLQAVASGLEFILERYAGFYV
jgi:hypothetical protein